MSGPIFFNKSKSLRTYDRKAQQKRSVSNKTNPVPKTPIVQPSFTQILNENNSMFLEIDLTNLEPGTFNSFFTSQPKILSLQNLIFRLKKAEIRFGRIKPGKLFIEYFRASTAS